MKALARIAGLDPQVMYLNADLTGVDLRTQDVSFLKDLNTNFEGAILTSQQRDLLRRGRSQDHKLVTRKAIRDARIQLITKFLEAYPQERLGAMEHRGDEIEVDFLPSLLLDPVVETTASNPNDQFGSDYMSAVLNGLSRLVFVSNAEFFGDLYALLGSLFCPVDKNVRAVLSRLYLPTFGEQLGSLLASMRPTPELDAWWIVDVGSEDGRKTHALQIARHRKVHPYAVESYVKSAKNISEMVEFLTEVTFEVDNDLAERLALYIVSGDWPPSETRFVLDAKLPLKVRNAVFRQLLAQGNERRITHVITWLSDNRSEAGALSLENAFVHIEDFELAYQLATQLAPYMRPNQWKVIDGVLSTLAYRDEDRSRLRKLRKQVGSLVPARP